MSALAIGVIVFVCLFGGALLGIFLSSVLPKHHLSAGTKDVIRVAMAMIATMAASVVGLLIASAKTSFLEAQANLLRIPVAYASMLYILRNHIDLVRERLKKQ